MQLRAPRSHSSSPASVGHWLEHRRRDDGARPLVVWYGPGGERVELSAVTFANWVDKTVNLLGDLGWDDAPVVGAPLLHDRAGHWVSLVWAAATWQLGGEVRAVEARRVQAVDVAVIGPDSPRPLPGVDTVACSLDPLGGGFDTLAKGLVDYHEVLAQPDVHTPALLPDPDDPAWHDDAGTRTHAELVAAAGSAGGDSRRVLVSTHGLDPWTIITHALLGPLAGGGSAVVVEGTIDPARLAAIAAAEKAVTP
ncbi:TIGR03089 family protein [Propionibacteriaceae bacterium G1746]|uniref:TIGR03089 family protein n=1 Tax=Aestuariimicrobium sp. G57 TaxID=3418485 RepID=UPI003C1379AD